MGLAIFDLDNTLLGGDSDHAWGEFLIARQLVDADLHSARNDEFYRQYTEGRLDIHDYVRFTLGPVLGFTLNELSELHQQFMAEFVRPMILPRATALIEGHKAKGDYCLIMSATNCFITGPIAAELGVHDLLATDLVIQGNHYTGDISGVPCFQEGKVIRLQQWLELRNEQYSIGDSTFYSDSANDLPLLEAVAVPVAVDPDDRLAEHARQNDWEVLSLREP
ncbi:MAG: HAD family hydrolase [Gammaproteobacteria bacterium]|nr:HAD family hydrolase [Pseudomonadales bacterium]MCP5347550.1 HAD family hydrolase [Pseudomonadales bacterium]